MTIKYALLGFLSWQPWSGYDLKKMISQLTFFYWSGNNNQIYKTLLSLLEEGLVTQEVQHQESLPAKKIYSITEKGRDGLREWILSSPSLPELRSTFLVQLAWADQLEAGELDLLLSEYEHEVEVQVQMEREKARRGTPSPQRSPREVFLWEMISENVISSYENQLNWVRGLRRRIQQQNNNFKESLVMNCTIKEREGQRYVEAASGTVLIQNINDALDLIAYCGENDTNRLMLHASNLTEDFFDLKTGLAGDILQKFVNYYIKAAAVIPQEQVGQGRFREMALEANRGQHFRVFQDVQEAENWLINS